MFQAEERGNAGHEDAHYRKDTSIEDSKRLKVSTTTFNWLYSLHLFINDRDYKGACGVLIVLLRKSLFLPSYK